MSNSMLLDVHFQGEAASPLRITTKTRCACAVKFNSLKNPV